MRRTTITALLEENLRKTAKQRITALDLYNAKALIELRAISAAVGAANPAEWIWRVESVERESPLVSVCWPIWSICSNNRPASFEARPEGFQV